MKNKYYSLTSMLRFGKHKGACIQEIIQKDKQYIMWCVKNLTHFYIREEVINYIYKNFPKFAIPEKDSQLFLNKIIKTDIDRSDEYYHEYYEYTSEEYDEMYLAAFDGHVDAFWNVD